MSKVKDKVKVIKRLLYIDGKYFTGISADSSAISFSMVVRRQAKMQFLLPCVAHLSQITAPMRRGKRTRCQ